MIIPLPLILVVDDDDKIREALSRALGRYGYRTVQASDGQEALAKYADSVRDGDSDARIALVLTDVDMPTMDGIQLAAELRKIQPRLPIVFLTGKPELPGLVGETVVVKPAMAPKIVATFRQLLTPLGSIPPPSGPVGNGSP